MAAKKIKVGGVLQYKDLTMIGIMGAPDRPGLAAAVFAALGSAHINAQFIVQSIDLNNESHIQFCIAEEDLASALAVLEPVAEKWQAAKIIQSPRMALLSVFGPDFRERPGIAGQAFSALAQAGINIAAISTSISTVTCVIDEEHHTAALDALHAVFDLP